MERDHRKEEIGSGMHHYVEVGTTYLRVKSLEPENNGRTKTIKQHPKNKRERTKLTMKIFSVIPAWRNLFLVDCGESNFS